MTHQTSHEVMSDMEGSTLIYQKLASVMRQVGAVSKTEINTAQKYKFRGIDNIMNELHNIFAENDVFVTTHVVDYTAETTPVETEYNGAKKYTIWTTTRAMVEFNFFTVDGSSVKSVVVGEGKDSADKSMNKALSAAYKYALLQMFLIPTEDRKDADYDTPETAVEKKKAVSMTLDSAIRQANAAKTIQELVDIYNRNPILRDNNMFSKCLTENKTRLNNATN